MPIDLTLAAGLGLALPVELTTAGPSWEGTLAYHHRANLAYGRGRYDQALADFLRPQSRTGN
jgi:hypothetical protein